MIVSQSQPSADAGSDIPRSPVSQPSAGMTWRRVPAVTSCLTDSFTARARRIATDLTGFIRAERLDQAEAEIMAAISDLRDLRFHVRQLRAEARAETRLNRSAA